MASSRLTEVLYDSETVLRLVDREIEELRDDSDTPAVAGNPLAVMLSLMEQTNAGALEVLTSLHESRTALQDVTVREIQDCSAKLREVASATEIATSRILDGLERAHALVDQLDRVDAGAHDDSGRTADAVRLRGRLRDELFALMGALQFQDITSQQLGHVTKMLCDAERRVHATASLLEGGLTEAAVIAAEPAPTFAESATTSRAYERQQTADAMFRERQPRRTVQ
jgi:hypothetical protein